MAQAAKIVYHYIFIICYLLYLYTVEVCITRMVRLIKSYVWHQFTQEIALFFSALYVVDLKRFRRIAAGDRLRGQYQGLSQDPNSLSNLDQVSSCELSIWLVVVWDDEHFLNILSLLKWRILYVLR